MKVKQKKGISLIVLVITIIVMIILATAIILSLNGSGIISKSKESVKESNKANLKEAASLAYSEYDLAIKTGETISVTADVYVKEKLKEQSFSDELIGLLEISNQGEITMYTEAIIPEGFVISPYEGERLVSEGLVIYELNEGETEIPASETMEVSQTTRNQFVWIPVPDINEFVRVNWQNKSDFNQYSEPSLYNGSTKYQYDTEVEEYNSMYESVKKHRGFYIARYETGTTTTTRRNETFSNGTTGVVITKNAIVYDNVGWGPSMTEIEGDVYYGKRNQGAGAVILSKKIYNAEEEDVVSTLCYGVQWDAVMKFMKNIENPTIPGKKYIEDSTNMQWGGLSYIEANKTRRTGIDVEIDVDEDGIVDLIGINKVKNIYDMSGNVEEWTMEAYSSHTRATRGSNYLNNFSATHRSGLSFVSTSNNASCTGFRVALYLK